MRRLALALALALSMTATAAAQGGGHGMKWLDEKTLAAAKELGRSLTTWARAEVIPEVQAWKTRLDNSLSPADLTALNDLRRRSAELRDRRTALAAAMRTAWKSEDYAALKQARDDMKALGAEREEILQSLRPIAEASRETLMAIGETAMPSVRQWATEARSIGEAWYEQNKGTISPMAAGAIGRLMKHRQDLFAMIEPKLRTKAAAARFMLWDGEDFTRQFEQMLQNGDIEAMRELNLE